MKIEWEDLDDLFHEVAQRAGYDISECEGNPLYGKVKTVEDFVLFLTHQPKIRQAERPWLASGAAPMLTVVERFADGLR